LSSNSRKQRSPSPLLLPIIFPSKIRTPLIPFPLEQVTTTPQFRHRSPALPIASVRTPSPLREAVATIVHTCEIVVAVRTSSALPRIQETSRVPPEYHHRAAAAVPTAAGARHRCRSNAARQGRPIYNQRPRSDLAWTGMGKSEAIASSPAWMPRQHRMALSHHRVSRASVSGCDT
jgi:hypothetical protein